MYASHKVVAYPSVALRQSRLSVNRGDSTAITTASSAGTLVGSNNSKDINMIPKINPASTSRPRSLSAGRTRQTSNGIVQDVYDKLGINRMCMGSCEDSHSFGKGSSASPGTMLEKFPSRENQTTTRGRLRQLAPPIGLSHVDSPDRRARSLSRGRIRTLWPPGQVVPEISASPKRSNRSPSNGTIIGGNSNCNSSTTSASNCKGHHAAAGSFEWNEEKKDEYEPAMGSFLKPSSKQEFEDDALFVTSPSVKDRLRFYAESLAGQSTKTLPKIENSQSRAMEERSYRLQKHGNPPWSDTCNVFVNGNNPLPTESEHTRIDECKQVIANNAKCSDVAGTGSINSRNSQIRKGGQNGSLANAFLTAIGPKPLAIRTPNSTPMLEIQTSRDEANGDTVSISMSSVSVDEFSRAAPAEVTNVNNPITFHGNHIGITSNPTNDLSGVGCHRSKVPTLEYKKVPFLERDRLSTYKHSMNAGREPTILVGNITLATGSESDRLSTSCGALLQSNNEGTMNEISRKLENLVEERVNARMTDYETRMETMIMKFMQTVDEKMSARIKAVESKINHANVSLRKLQDQQQLSIKNHDYPMHKE